MKFFKFSFNLFLCLYTLVLWKISVRLKNQMRMFKRLFSLSSPVHIRILSGKTGSRPLSLTSVVGKLLERSLRDRIYRHLERQRMIRDGQHGFVSGKSCLTNLIGFFEGVTKKVDEGSAVDVVYMDVRRHLTRYRMAVCCIRLSLTESRVR